MLFLLYWGYYSCTLSSHRLILICIGICKLLVLLRYLFFSHRFGIRFLLLNFLLIFLISFRTRLNFNTTIRNSRCLLTVPLVFFALVIVIKGHFLFWCGVKIIFFSSVILIIIVLVLRLRLTTVIHYLWHLLFHDLNFAQSILFPIFLSFFQISPNQSLAYFIFQTLIGNRRIGGGVDGLLAMLKVYRWIDRCKSDVLPSFANIILLSICWTLLIHDQITLFFNCLHRIKS